MADPEFGKRVRRARERLGVKRHLVASWAGLVGRRLELIEAGQLDSSDLPESQIAALARALQCPVGSLVGEQEIVEFGSASLAAYRASGTAAQTTIAFGDECPNCGDFANGARCRRCGHPLE